VLSIISPSAALLTERQFERIAWSFIKEAGIVYRIHNSFICFHPSFQSLDSIYFFFLPEVFIFITSLLSFCRYLLYFLPPFHHLYPFLPFLNLSFIICFHFISIFCFISLPFLLFLSFSFHIFLPGNHAMTVIKVKVKLSLCLIKTNAMKMYRKWRYTSMRS
jgi:hypothetical protein